MRRAILLAVFISGLSIASASPQEEVVGILHALDKICILQSSSTILGVCYHLVASWYWSARCQDMMGKCRRSGGCKQLLTQLSGSTLEWTGVKTQTGSMWLRGAGSFRWGSSAILTISQASSQVYLGS